MSIWHAGGVWYLAWSTQPHSWAMWAARFDPFSPNQSTQHSHYLSLTAPPLYRWQNSCTEKLKRFQGSGLDQSCTPKSEALYFGKTSAPSMGVCTKGTPGSLLEHGLEQLCPGCILPAPIDRGALCLADTLHSQREQQRPCAHLQSCTLRLMVTGVCNFPFLNLLKLSCTTGGNLVALASMEEYFQ